MKIIRLLPLAVVLSALTALTAGCANTPSDTSVEAGFARDMATHHAQAAEMSFIIRDATRDEQLRTLAYDIIVTQSAQRGMFMAWLQQWGLPQAAPGPRMAWMPADAHAAHNSPQHPTSPAPENPGTPAPQNPRTPAPQNPNLMPGMATDAEMQALRAATGRDAEVLFLKLMIRHHEGGVQMAKALLDQSTREDVVSVVRGMESTQAVEIRLMSEMLAERGTSPSATGSVSPSQP